MPWAGWKNLHAVVVVWGESWTPSSFPEKTDPTFSGSTKRLLWHSRAGAGGTNPTFVLKNTKVGRKAEVQVHQKHTKSWDSLKPGLLGCFTDKYKMAWVGLEWRWQIWDAPLFADRKSINHGWTLDKLSQNELKWIQLRSRKHLPESTKPFWGRGSRADVPDQAN